MTTSTAPTVDLYREIHKGLRHALFNVTVDAGALDVTDDGAVARLVASVRDVIALLLVHHEHEDWRVQPLIERHAPDLLEAITSAHERVDTELAVIEVVAERLEQGLGAERDQLRSQLYAGLASFTALYLDHMAVEEHDLMPALSDAMSQDELRRVLTAIRVSVPTDEMCRALRYVLPALDVDERTGLLGGMQAMTRPEVFEGFRALAEEVLGQADYSVLAGRLGLGIGGE
jgi:hemerythrin-like domain-containing protein